MRDVDVTELLVALVIDEELVKKDSDVGGAEVLETFVDELALSIVEEAMEAEGGMPAVKLGWAELVIAVFVEVNDKLPLADDEMLNDDEDEVRVGAEIEVEEAGGDDKVKEDEESGLEVAVVELILV